ncbi:MAG TPA: tetratricopeptide repeat protein [Cyclobacteriaceae bacterium]|jgi:tetratricopeptide (TPR) repeat protein/DNA-binding CsgD family transcriptional regulator|nr:tetratricopeptide repeat protein [Cyclobacteriaceae bacterium]
MKKNKNSTIRILAKCLFILCFLTAFSLSFAQTPKIDSLQTVLKTLPEDSNRVKTLIEICKFMSSQNTEKMNETAEEALLLAQKVHFEKGEAHANIYHALYYNKVGDAPKAISFLLKALGYFEKIEDSGSTAMVFNNIGVIYLTQDQLDEAMDNFKKAYTAWNKLNSKSGLVRALNNIASVYEEKKNDSLALINYTQALKLCEEIPDKRFSSLIINSIGMIHLRRKEYETSMTFQERALQLAIETDDEALQAQSYGAMSEIYIALGQPEKALTIAERGLEHAQKITSKRDLRDSYHRVSKAHEKLGHFQKAYEFQSLYVALNDSLKNSDNTSSIEKLKSKYELGKKESEIVLLKQRHQVEASRRDIAIVTLVAILIIGFLLYNRYRLITQRRLALKRQLLNLYTQGLIEKSETINRINAELEQFKSSGSNEDVQIAKIDKILQSNILTNEDWDNFKKAFEDIYPAFFSKLRYKYPAITAAELRLSALIKLNLSIKEMASMLGISPESVKKSRYRLKRKLGLTENEVLEDFIEKLEIPNKATASYQEVKLF